MSRAAADIAADIGALLDGATCSTCVHCAIAPLSNGQDGWCRLHPEGRDTHPDRWCGQHPTRAAVAAYLESETVSALFRRTEEAA